MRRIINAFAALAAFGLVYLLAGFIAWDWDASAWDIGARFYVAVTGGIAAVGVFFTMEI